MQKQRRLEHKNLRKDHGELLMNIRAALQNMVAMLIYVRRGTVKTPKKQTDKKSSKEDKDDTEELESVIPTMVKVDVEGKDSSHWIKNPISFECDTTRLFQV